MHASTVTDQLINFEKRIHEFAIGEITPFFEKEAVSSQIKSQLVNQVGAQAVQRSREMMGPTLVWVRASNPSPRAAEQALTQHGLPAITAHWHQFIRARCEAISQQLLDIAQLMPDPIIDLQVMDGDPHNGARQPLKITTDSARGRCDYLYKSIDAAPMTIVHRVAGAVAQKLDIANFVDDAVSSTQNSYLRKFSPVSKPATRSEIEQYFFVFGAIVSVASSLEITDLHFENIIATKGGPKIIDIEFILSNSQYQNTKWSYKNCGLFEPETSPVGQIYSHQQIFPTYRLIEGNVQYSHLEEKRSDLHVLYDDAGNPIRTQDYAKIIGQGARAADAVLKKEVDGIGAIVSSLDSKNHKIRCWMRGTAYYRILQLQLWLPGKSLEDQIVVMRSKLASKDAISSKIPSETRQKIIKAEIHDLLKGDIPYFWIDGKSGNLMHSTGLLEEHFGLPTADALKQHYAKWKLRNFSRDMRPIIDRMLRGPINIGALNAR